MELTSFMEKPVTTQVDTIQGYYKLHARLYEASRWTFLFGRKRILDVIKPFFGNNKTLLEVGCGTGHNLAELANRHSNLQLLGVDISPDMLNVATKKLSRYGKRITLVKKPYFLGDWALPTKPDITLYAYCLTMINPGWEDSLERAYEDLEDGGVIAVVDFHDSPFSIFRRWMGYNHVRMEAHLLPALQKQFSQVHVEIREAYGGLWRYFMFVGRKS